MAERLDAAQRRAQIIAATRAMIAEDGPHTVGLRAVARRLGMTAPGIKHHFPMMTDLYRAVIDAYNADQDELVGQIAAAAGDELTLMGLVDALAIYYQLHSMENRNFDLLEFEALDPEHPAHGIFSVPSVQPLPITRELAERDYEDPDTVIKLLSVAADGLRFRWIQARGSADIWSDWVDVRDDLFACFRKKPTAPPDPPLPDPADFRPPPR